MQNWSSYETQAIRVVDEIAMHYDSIKARLQQGVDIGLDELITGSPTGTSWLLQQLHQDFPNSRIKLPGEPK